MAMKPDVVTTARGFFLCEPQFCSSIGNGAEASTHAPSIWLEVWAVILPSLTGLVSRGCTCSSHGQISVVTSGDSPAYPRLRPADQCFNHVSCFSLHPASKCCPPMYPILKCPHKGGACGVVQVCQGYMQSLRPERLGLALQVDIAVTPFLEPGPVLDNITRAAGLRDPRDFARASPIQLRKANKATVGVKVPLTPRSPALEVARHHAMMDAMTLAEPKPLGLKLQAKRRGTPLYSWRHAF